MAKEHKDKSKQFKKKQKKDELLPLDKINYQIMIAGIFVIILGYLALSTGSWDGFMSLTVAPILLVIGYCVIIPIGIIYRKKNAPQAAEVQPATEVHA